MNYYEEKQARKLERYTELAEKKAIESEQAYQRSHDMLDAIPFGQPILIGHHSEKADRNYRNRAIRTFERGIELKKTAEYYAEKAERIENPYAISSDDPEAITKLKEKLAGIESEIERVKAHNKNCRQIHLAAYEYANGTHISNNNGSYTTYAIVKDLEDCPCGECPQIVWELKRVPQDVKTIIENYARTGKLVQPELKPENKKIESWVLQNLNGNKSRIKERIDQLQKLVKVEEIEETLNNITVSIDKEMNRVKIEFPGKPAPEIISKLKQSGFHWSPFNKVWMRMISDCAISQAREIQREVKA